MYSLLTPRWVLSAALAAFLIGVVGLFAGELKFSPIGLLIGELLLIYGAILWTTPTIPPLSSRPTTTPRVVSDEPPAEEVPIESVPATAAAEPATPSDSADDAR